MFDQFMIRETSENDVRDIFKK